MKQATASSKNSVQKDLQFFKGHEIFKVLDTFLEVVKDGYARNLLNVDLDDPQFSVKTAYYRGMVDGVRQLQSSIDLNLSKGENNE